MDSNPLVSICCLTYNHAPYINQCLDGFLMQKCAFTFEVLIHDDASSDGTKDIIKTYEERYPDIIKPIYQTENQFSKGISATRTYNFPRAKGKYIAMCEGDDYWVDPLKLQKQVDFLEQHPDYTFSMGRVDMYIQKNGQIKPRKESINADKSETYQLADYLKAPFSQTSSFLFRSGVVLPEWVNGTHALDQALVIVLTGEGKIKYHKDVLSIYRVHQSSVTKQKIDLDQSIARLKLFVDAVNKYTNCKYNKILQQRMKREIKLKKLMVLRSHNKFLYYIRRAIMDLSGV